MSVIRSFFISFSTYSVIPMPQFQWKKEDMGYVLCFFPWVGAVIGLAGWGWMRLCLWQEAGELCRVLVGTAIPLFLTGGFHVDGYMDTMDAVHSYQDRERKLEILKDPHIGAFSVIKLVTCLLFFMAAYSQITEEKLFLCFCGSFFVSRALSGISLLCFEPAKKGGSLRYCADSAKRKIVLPCLFLQLALCFGFLLYQSPKGGCVILLLAIGVTLYYRWRAGKEFGGITGDTAGYFVTLFESAAAIALALAGKW